MVVVSVLGVGQLGGNIAGDLAFNGHTVRAWDKFKPAIDNLNKRIEHEKLSLKRDGLMLHEHFIVRISSINESPFNKCQFKRAKCRAFQSWRTPF